MGAWTRTQYMSGGQAHICPVDKDQYMSGGLVRPSSSTDVSPPMEPSPSEQRRLDGLQIAEIDACAAAMAGDIVPATDDVDGMDDDAAAAAEAAGGEDGAEAAVDMAAVEAGYEVGQLVQVPNMNDLYLFYQGGVYVFQSVSYEKVGFLWFSWFVE